MSKFENVYELKEDISANGLTFFFVSKGKQNIIKTISLNGPNRQSILPCNMVCLNF